MEIRPDVQLTLLLRALLWGVGFGLLWDLLTVSRILLGAYTPPAHMRARYARPLPLLHRPVPFDMAGRGRRLWRHAVVGVGDVLFCLSLAACVILLLYRYNSGAFRLSVPLLTLLGLGLFRAASARFSVRLTAYLAYGAGVLACYGRAAVALPLRLLRRLWARVLCRPMRALCRVAAEKRKTYFEKRKGRLQHGKKKKSGGHHAPAMGDRRSDPSHIHRGCGHRRRPPDGVESASQAGRGAGAARKRAERHP